MPVVVLASEQTGWFQREERAKDAWAALCGQAGVSPPAPYAMVGSGHEIKAGLQASASVYWDMVDRELARPAGAIVHAHRETLSTSKMVVTVQVTNLTSVTLSSQANAAVVSVWDYDPFAGGTYTYSVLKDQPIAEPLAPGHSARYEIPAPPGRWRYLAVVEYRPGGDAGSWDMLQAAIVRSAALPPMPTPVPPTVAPTPPTPIEVTPPATTAPSPTVTPPAGLYLPWLAQHAPVN
jgi:hypothetical protein